MTALKGHRKVEVILRWSGCVGAVVPGRGADSFLLLLLLRLSSSEKPQTKCQICGL